MQYFIEIFTPTKFREILHHYVKPVKISWGAPNYGTDLSQ